MKETLQQQRDFYRDLMGETGCPEIINVSKEEIEKSIVVCRCMLQYSIDHHMKEEISYWRKLLQENKVQRRMLNT